MAIYRLELSSGSLLHSVLGEKAQRESKPSALCGSLGGGKGFCSLQDLQEGFSMTDMGCTGMYSELVLETGINTIGQKGRCEQRMLPVVIWVEIGSG